MKLNHLPADAIGLPPWAGAVLASRPAPPSLPGMVVPDTLEHVPQLTGSFDEDSRAELVHALESHLAAHEPHVRVVDSVRSLTHPEAAIVIAGQQPGFLGGPLYNVYKALHAIRLARALAEQWGVPVVPAFWNHADDHDVAEVHHLWIQNPNLDLRKVGLAGMSSGRTPLSEIVFDAEKHRLGATAELLRQNLWDCDAQGPAIELFLPRDGETFASAFTRVMLELFGADGLIVIEPDWIRPMLSRSLANIVACGAGEGLDAGSAALRAAGSEPAIDRREAALVFHHVDGKRNALRLTGPDFRYDGEAGSRTASELAAEIVQNPAAWSPGALLRPLVQDSALPVVAYVGGWGELAYHAQLPPLRERAGVARTAFVPRLSATIVEPATQESLEKLGLDLADAFRARGKLGEVDDEKEESAVAARLRTIARETGAQLLAEREALAEVDRGLAQQLKKVADQAGGLVERLAKKADRVAANAAGRGRRHHRRVDGSLFPRETPQERVRGTLEVVARFGRDWIDALGHEIEPLPTEHLVVTLDEGDLT